MNRIAEWRACRLGDPIERLRYLRRAARPSSGPKPALAAAGCLVLVLLPRSQGPRVPPPVSPARTGSARLAEAGRIWLVETGEDHEIYSNGLRIETQWRTQSSPRRPFPVLPRDGTQGDSRIWHAATPAGIVFHATESDPAPFIEDRNSVLLRQSEGTLAYARSRRAYHFVIDRFGRAFRIVPESQIAFHAGESVWADSHFLFADLNASFLGVAFDTRTGAEPPLTPAQVSTGRALVEMLRARYAIPRSDCVTHAQVSVNRGNGEIGWHTDFASGFPFEELGLPDNYALPPASLYLAGFDYDRQFLRSAGSPMLRGIDLAEGMLHREAISVNLSESRYRGKLRERYQNLSRSRP